MDVVSQRQNTAVRLGVAAKLKTFEAAVGGLLRSGGQCRQHRWFHEIAIGLTGLLGAVRIACEP
jgi:hypothetical protein